MTLDMTRPTVAARWPGLYDDLPGGLRNTIASPVARSLFRAAVSRLPVTVEIDRGPGRREVLGRGGPTMRIVRPEEFYARIGRDGLIGFGESYLTGAWESDDLVGFLTVLAREMGALIPPRLQRLRAVAVRRVPRRHRNSRTGSRQNIAHHYDLSNDLFALFLDRTMTYSSALFESDVTGDVAHVVAGPPQRATSESLPDAIPV